MISICEICGERGVGEGRGDGGERGGGEWILSLKLPMKHILPNVQEYITHHPGFRINTKNCHFMIQPTTDLILKAAVI